MDVDGLARISCVLLLLYGDDAEDGVGELIVKGEVGQLVVLIVGQQDVVAVPLDGRRRIRFNMTLQIHVKLQGLAQAFSRDLDGGLELNLHVHIPARALTDHVGGHAVVSATVLLGNLLERQVIAFGHGLVGGKRSVILAAPVDLRWWISTGVATQHHLLAISCHNWSGRVVRDNRRPAHDERHIRSLLVRESYEHLALIDSAIGLLDVL